MKKSILTLNLILLLTVSMFAQNDYETIANDCKELGYFGSQECMMGAKIPTFEGITYEGKQINNLSIENKVAVINFWFIACPPCIAELGGLNEVVEKYKERDDVVFLSFTREDKAILEKEFFPNHELNFEIIPDSEETILNVFKSWWGYPTTLIIDKSGKIHSITSGGSIFEEEARENIKGFLEHGIDACLEK